MGTPIALQDYFLKYKLAPSDDLSPEWWRFIRDHKQIIIDNATLYNISMSFMATTEYSVAKFLRDNHIDPGLARIVQFINDINHEMDFINIATLYVPHRTYIDELYMSYKIVTSAHL